MATHSSTLAWKIPWTEEPGRLQSMGSLRVGHDWGTSLWLFTFRMNGEGNGNPIQCSCLENPKDGGAWWATVYGVAQSRTRLKWLSSSIKNEMCFSSLWFLIVSKSWTWNICFTKLHFTCGLSAPVLAQKISWWCSGVIREGNGTPLQYSCLENPRDGGTWWAAVHGVAKSRTRLSDFTFTFHFHALEKEMATHSSVLAWRTPGMGEPDTLCL